MIPLDEGEQLSMISPGERPEPLLCWLWLAHVLGPANSHAEQLVDWCDDPVRIWEERESLTFRRAAGPAAAHRAQEPNCTPWSFRPLVSWCERMGVRILTYDDPDYPLDLIRIPDLPLVLYCTGNPYWLNAPGRVGMVGSRRPDNYGRQIAASMGQSLARSGAVIVSGLADGLDSEGHRAAVEANTPTIGVQGVSIDRTFPASNRLLRQKIEENGCVISEYAPGEEYSPKISFLQRNRLIAGLSQVLVVVEAKEKSGTMSTVAYAERYHRPVYAVPGDINRDNASGTNRLIQSGRARMLLDAEELMEPLGLAGMPAALAPSAAEEPALSPKERQVLACMGQEPKSVEELSAGCGIPAGELSAVLMGLVLSGRIKQLPGQRYCLL